MVNVTVLKMKDIKKYLIGIILTIILIIALCKIFPQIIKEKGAISKVVLQKNMINCLEKTVPVISSLNEEETKIEDKENKENVLEGILRTQISSIQKIENIEEEKEGDEQKEETTNVEQENNPNVEIAKTGLQTQVVTVNPIADKSNTVYGKVKIKNETEYQLTQDMLTPNITIENKNIVLFHTHSCESYTSSESYPYTPTGTFRTTDPNYNVIRVGTELENHLKQFKFNVIHSTSFHDYPAYNGSYTRSLATVEGILKTTPSDIVIDVHRDAIGSKSDYAPIVKIGENDVAAQLMFVIRN